MARELPYIAAINEAIRLEMQRDESVLYFGQNIATTKNDPFLQEFGSDRVRVTPISETAEIGMGIGAALAGYRPVVELYMAEFMLVGMDQVVNEAPRFRYMTGGRALVAAERLAGEGVSAEVIAPRTLEPLDTATILESVAKTGHLVLVDQATLHASASAVIAAEVADAGFSYLKAPIRQVTALDATIPYSRPMEEYVLPNEDKIVAAVHQVLGSAPVAAT